MNFRLIKQCLLCCALITSPLSNHTNPVYGLETPLPNPQNGLGTVPLLRGITIHPNNPFQMDFMIDTDHGVSDQETLRETINKQIQYFLTALTLPNDQLWVNLSPYEKQRIVPELLAETTMGQTMLQQDLTLKQFSAQLLSPTHPIGEQFWTEIYRTTFKKLGHTNIPISALQKIWIVPESAEIQIHGQHIFITSSRLKVLTESDYINHEKSPQNKKNPVSTPNATQSKLQEMIIPVIEKAVNDGNEFASLRQIYHAVVLATWYKRHLQHSFLGQNYSNTGYIHFLDKVKNSSQIIYDEYLNLLKDEAFHIIKDDYDPVQQNFISRQYFSGGHTFENIKLTKPKKHSAINLQEVLTTTFNGIILLSTLTLSIAPAFGQNIYSQSPEPSYQLTQIINPSEQSPKASFNMILKPEELALSDTTKIDIDPKKMYQFRSQIITLSHSEELLTTRGQERVNLLIAEIEKFDLQEENRFNQYWQSIKSDLSKNTTITDDHLFNVKRVIDNAWDFLGRYEFALYLYKLEKKTIGYNPKESPLEMMIKLRYESEDKTTFFGYGFGRYYYLLQSELPSQKFNIQTTDAVDIGKRILDDQLENPNGRITLKKDADIDYQSGKDQFEEFMISESTRFKFNKTGRVAMISHGYDENFARVYDLFIYHFYKKIDEMTEDNYHLIPVVFTNSKLTFLSLTSDELKKLEAEMNQNEYTPGQGGVRKNAFEIMAVALQNREKDSERGRLSSNSGMPIFTIIITIIGYFLYRKNKKRLKNVGGIDFKTDDLTLKTGDNLRYPHWSQTDHKHFDPLQLTVAISKPFPAPTTYFKLTAP